MLPAYDVALIGNVKIFTSDFDWCEKKKKKKKKIMADICVLAGKKG